MKHTAKSCTVWLVEASDAAGCVQESCRVCYAVLLCCKVSRHTPALQGRQNKNAKGHDFAIILGKKKKRHNKSKPMPLGYSFLVVASVLLCSRCGAVRCVRFGEREDEQEQEQGCPSTFK